MRLAAVDLMISVALFFAVASGSAADPQGAKPAAEKLLNPAQLNETAPDKFQVKFDTSKGEFVIEVTRAWAPNGADRFYNLVKNGYYDNCRFFRVVANFMAQFGINGNPKLNAIWSQARIKDDPVKQSNGRGYITYAMGGPNTRTTQLFISFRDNSASLDKQGFSPFGKVIEGMKVVDSLYSGYGDDPSFGGNGPVQQRAQQLGNAYLEKDFPKLDYIKTATIIK
jgi:peptidyl-prolyl cis-trans isomerase A (cyclophilin A)